MYGYRFPEVDLAPVLRIKPDVNITINPEAPLQNPERRVIVATSLGMNVKDHSLPHVDPKDPDTVLMGLEKRVCFQPPPYNKPLLDELSGFVKRFIKKNFVPLDQNVDTSVNGWLKDRHYEAWRKKQLTDAYDRMEGIHDKSRFKVDGFIKDEHYPEFKHARGINARSDYAKCLFGPIFSLIEKEIFKHPAFIKKIPKPERAKYIMEKLYAFNALYASTDYSSYEGHFVKYVLQAIERPLYEYMTQALPEHKEFMDMYDKYILGINDIVFNLFKVKIEATRMTGEMNTSLGNGFANLMIMLFVAEKSGYDDFNCVVEGDDGLGQVFVDRPLKQELFLQLGFTIKLEMHEQINTASFCGNIFDPEDLNIITDVREVLASFGWTRALYKNSKLKVMKGLLRAKAYSLIYEYPGCPILQTLALKVIELTIGYRAKIDKSNEYLREMNAQMFEYIKSNGLPQRTVGIRTRILIEQLYGVSIESQLHIENYISQLTEITELNHPLISDIMAPVWRVNDEKYTRVFPDRRLLDERLFLIDNHGIPWNPNFVIQSNNLRNITT